MTAKIKLNAASGGGSFSLQAPSSSSNNRVMTLPDTADGTILTTTNPKAGNIIQVLQTLKKDVYSGNHYGNYNELTGLSVTITPTSSSNKLLFTTGIEYSTETGQLFEVKLYDGSSEITAANSTTGSSSNAWIQSYNKNSTDAIISDNINMAHGSYLHTVSDTNAHTYKIYVRAGSTTLYINRRENDAGNGGTSYLNVMEIAV